jgi:preprotein translocase subunit SecG
MEIFILALYFIALVVGLVFITKHERELRDKERQFKRRYGIEEYENHD